MAPTLVALFLIAYPNLLALLCARRRWDQWHAFSIGNALLALALLAGAASGGLLPAVWGHVSAGGILLGAVAGLVPLAVILTLLFLPGQLGRDIVASGIDGISTRQFMYRVGVQVALTTVVCEELAFRGVLYALLAHAVSAPWTVALNAIVFGLWHVTLQYTGFSSQSGAARWAAALGGACVYALLGLLLALVRDGAGGLLAPIITHGVLDVFMFIGMFVRRRQLAANAS